MKVKFLRVIGSRSTSQQPAVVAVVDGIRVKWNPSSGWLCDCDDMADDGTCPHVDAVADLLDDRVIGDAR